MNSLSSSGFVVLAAIALMSSCSRPVAYFQPAVRQSFAARTLTQDTLSAQPTFEPNHQLGPPAEYTSSASEPTLQAKQVVRQLEAFVGNDSKLGSSRKLARRLEQINQVLNTATKSTVSSAPVSTKKSPFMERTILKKIDKKLKQHLAPDQPRTKTSNLMLGIILGLVGLLLIIIASGFFNTIGIIALVVGIGLIALTYLGYLKPKG